MVKPTKVAMESKSRNTVVPDPVSRRQSLANLVSKANMKRFAEERSSDFQGEVSKRGFFKARNLELQFRKFQVNQRRIANLRFFIAGIVLSIIGSAVYILLPFLYGSKTELTLRCIFVAIYILPVLITCISGLIVVRREIDVDTWYFMQVHFAIFFSLLTVSDCGINVTQYFVASTLDCKIDTAHDKRNMASTALIVISAPTVFDAHYLTTICISIVGFVVYLILPMIYLLIRKSSLVDAISTNIQYHYTDLIFMIAIAWLSTYLAQNRERRNRTEFYEKTISAQEFTMLKSELQGKTKKNSKISEDLIDTPMQTILEDLKNMAKDLQDDKKDILFGVIEVLSTSKNLYGAQLNKKAVDKELVRYLQDTANVGTEKETKKEGREAPTRSVSYSIDVPLSPEGMPSFTAGSVLLNTLLATGPIMDLVSPTWEFDILDYNIAVNENVIPCLFVNMMDQHQLTSRCRMDPEKMLNFVTTVQHGYVKTNTYHNAIHGASVLYDTNFFLAQEGIRKRISRIELCGTLIAAVIHDLGHDGYTNAYHVATQSPLAITYNDRTVLENYHSAALFTILSRDENNILKSFTAAEFKTIRNVVIECVLATDLKVHFDHLNKIKLLNSAWETKRALISDESLKQDTWDPSEGNIFALSTFIKLADLAHCAKNFYIHTKWCDLISEELFRQGDAERSKGLDLSAFCDRTNYNITKSQTGFINFLVAPLFHTAAPYFAQTTAYKQIENYTDSNIEMWKKLAEEGIVYIVGDSVKYVDKR